MGGDKKQVKDATVSRAYGKSLREHGLDVEELKFEYEYDALDISKPGHLEEARKEFTDKDLIQAVNAARSASARSKAQVAILEKNGIKAPKADDPEVVRRNLIRGMVTSGLPEELAAKMADDIMAQGAAAKQTT